jgi:hypothetical protein
MNLPIVRLELEGMRQSILHAFADFQMEQGAYVKKAVEDYCSEGHLRVIFQQEVQRVLDKTIQEEVQKFFTYGEGRKIVAEAVKLKLFVGLNLAPGEESDHDS